MSSSDESHEERIINQFCMANAIAVEATRLIIENELQPPNKRPRGLNKDRGRQEGHDKLVADYFSNNPVYNDVDFKRRFRLTRRLFVRIVSDLEREFDFFKQQWDAKALRDFLRYKSVRPLSDIWRTGNNIYESQLLTIFRLYTHCVNKHTVYPACLVAWIVCIEIGKIVPSHGGVNTIEFIILELASVILEAVASHDQWIWHAFFGVSGATNDIIVVNQSSVFNDIFEDKAPDSRDVHGGSQTADPDDEVWGGHECSYSIITAPRVDSSDTFEVNKMVALRLVHRSSFFTVPLGCKSAVSQATMDQV
ncbi:hypothetical protein OSB04_013381 [Centaurea solstitialis]|uniref:Uncharacterized protein n=1 Tax=Centaurea solstitialis TaxID=347529 RepID=A0AA38WFG0_9ASTR|nr:hypothetical protein OSB04_013381 [Centaurea solstitialis]